MKRMRIRINQQGQTTINVEGGQGADCRDFTRAVEEALGTVEQQELKEEYYQEKAVLTDEEHLLDREGGL